eukprot:SAG31_NODE_972_length_10644_cov_3.435372_5_plen_189_part_00
MSEADPKAMQSGGAIKRTQDDFRNLNKELKNPLLGNLPAVKAAASPVAQTASNAAVEEAPADLAPCRHPNNPICYFDMLIGDQPAGRIYFELHSHIVPKTCENFRQLCIGAVSRLNPGMKLHYKGSFMHRVVPGFMAQGGDFVSNDGSGELQRCPKQMNPCDEPDKRRCLTVSSKRRRGINLRGTLCR